ncbi:MAG TPA: response regulator [Rhodothermales bacterium]|nr:response regulator [Rhodothermales bacterium]
MNHSAREAVVLIAEDDADDMAITMRALRDGLPDISIHGVQDGEELLDYMHARGAYAGPGKAPRPGLILLDLNMPRKSGREALVEIKGEETFRTIPVVVLTTSNASVDVETSYNAGANAYLTKPLSYVDMLASMKSLTDFWFKCALLPDEQAAT